VVSRRGRVPGLPGVAALAGGVPLPAVREPVGMAVEQWSGGVLAVRPADVGDGGDDGRSHAHAVADVVCRGVADDQPEARRVRARGPAGAGAWLLPDGVGVAAPLPERDGAPPPGASGWLLEVDETFVGGPEKRRYGRAAQSKSLVAIAVEIKHPKGFGRVRMQRVEAIRKAYLIPFVCGAVQPGATVHTDGNQAYWTVPEHGYQHERNRGECHKVCVRQERMEPHAFNTRKEDPIPASLL
jgi:hypothetical protein